MSAPPAGPATPAFSAPAWRLGERRLAPPGRPLVMGVVNLTPDSFFPASRRNAAGPAVAAGLRMADEGADLLDLGAASSRPGAAPVPEAEEQARLLPALRALRLRTELPLTIDTTSAATARLALDAGADGINDITAGLGDPGLLPLAARRGCGLVLMHMQGDPRTMQDDPRYADAAHDVRDFLAVRVAAARAAGVAADRIAVDPGLGFGKRLADNLALLAALRELGNGQPLLVGASRKSFIAHLTGAPVAARLPGSLAALAAAFAGGAAVVRVHDVAASRQFLTVLAAIAAAGRPAAFTG
ncbi:MAG: dihydropteroate synthase [Candidatus Krumholzibacteriia bacterium]